MIRLTDVCKTYNPGSTKAFEALKAVNLAIETGELVILKGVSGSGKSTLLSIISAMEHPGSGDVIIDGKPVSKLPDLHASHFRAQTIGFVFQHFNLLEALSVAENIMLPLIPTGLKRAEITEKAQRSMALANISHKADQCVAELSGGEKQRCAIARALVNDPKLILCDEPTANLDHANSLAFIDVLKTFKALGKTVVVATHDPLFESVGIHDRLIQMKEGRLQ